MDFDKTQESAVSLSAQNCLKVFKKKFPQESDLLLPLKSRWKRLLVLRVTLPGRAASLTACATSNTFHLDWIQPSLVAASCTNVGGVGHLLLRFSLCWCVHGGLLLL